MHAWSWQVPSSIPPLEANEVHVWHASTERLAPLLDSFASLLDAGERARGDAYYAQVDRQRHLVTRGVLRTLVGHYEGTSPNAVRFDVGAFGKPSVFPPHHARLRFNVSHSGDIVLLAFARTGDVGVDVEQWNDRLGEPERTRIGDYVFSDAERAAIAQLSSEAERARAFYALWSRKEAYLKGTGAGISGGLAHVEISVDDVARLTVDRRDARAADRWSLRDIDVGAGYSAALASSPPDQEVALLVPPLHLFDA